LDVGLELAGSLDLGESWADDGAGREDLGVEEEGGGGGGLLGEGGRCEKEGCGEEGEL